MGFKTLGINAAVATAVVAGSAMAISPAQAATLTPGSFRLTPPTVTQSGSNFVLNFSGSVSNATGGLTGLNGLSFGPTSITLAPSGGNTFSFTTPVNNFLTGTLAGDPFTLNLLPSTFELIGTFPGAYALGTNALSFQIFSAGVLQLQGQANVSGSSSSLFRNAEFSAQAIPTPALLPGLIGLGVAAFRRRKTEVAEEAS
ncbi:PTPA-CTERM sorting domain-containing protein [Kovacikia minuta CCNUW1]|uniref:PTPA-CTERM sorting domain-containing protein n=1 Tax=Kovacikia minuta TaxID=2931930 RepID=UPI001CCB9013|nr:PTPA-CTERM sorting domain-containing protein [Kovacikia minuta]UBF27352.1 PTPA-CTERM sorting domain-containing protein [Kovacikia minuta CCNUW1]